LLSARKLMLKSALAGTLLRRRREVNFNLVRTWSRRLPAQAVPDFASHLAMSAWPITARSFSTAEVGDDHLAARYKQDQEDLHLTPPIKAARL
jgi:hypothetical protein